VVTDFLPGCCPRVLLCIGRWRWRCTGAGSTSPTPNSGLQCHYRFGRKTLDPSQRQLRRLRVSTDTLLEATSRGRRYLISAGRSPVTLMVVVIRNSNTVDVRGICLLRVRTVEILYGTAIIYRVVGCGGTLKSIRLWRRNTTVTNGRWKMSERLHPVWVKRKIVEER
jgi:hypothetical protein